MTNFFLLDLWYLLEEFFCNLKGGFKWAAVSVWEDNHQTMYKTRVQSDSGVFKLLERGHKLMRSDMITQIMYVNELE